MPLYLTIEQFGRSCNLTCFEVIIQLVAFLLFSIFLVLKVDFHKELDCWDVYLPLLLGDFFHIYHRVVFDANLRVVVVKTVENEKVSIATFVMCCSRVSMSSALLIRQNIEKSFTGVL